MPPTVSSLLLSRRGVFYGLNGRFCGPTLLLRPSSIPTTFATYAGMGFIVICGLILRLYRDEFTAVAGSVRFRIATFIQVTGQRAAVLLGAGFVVLVALLLTQSRGGILSTALGLFVFAILSLKTRKQGSPEQRKAVIVLGALLAAVAFLAFGDLVAGRITQQGVYDKGRIALYTTTLQIDF